MGWGGKVEILEEGRSLECIGVCVHLLFVSAMLGLQFISKKLFFLNV